MMRRLLFLTLTVLLAFPTGASAQWWLFPGSRHKKDTVSVTAPPSQKKEADVTVPTVTDNPSILESVLTDEPPFDDSRKGIRVALLLPFHSEDNPSGNFLDFYSGVLMAVQELAGIGYCIDLSVEDCASEGFAARCKHLKDIPIIIGPVNMEDINRCVSILPDNWLISPLEPKAEDFVSWCHVIQTPTPNMRQIDELVTWLKQDLRKNDRVVFLKDDTLQSGEMASGMILKMNEAGIRYEVSSSPSSSGRNIQGTTRYVLVSEDSNFSGDMVREIALMSMNGADVTLYSTSKIRSSSTVDAGNLHIARAHVTMNYFADTKSPEVMRFSEDYRERFKISPGMFSFHGYDVAKYFISMYDRYGSDWVNGLRQAKWRGLQSDFIFHQSGTDSGRINSSVRRVVYNNDNTITIQQ